MEVDDNQIIDYLDNITWEKIFENLDCKSLIKASESCRKFDEIISDSKKLLNKIKFKISFPEDPEAVVNAIRKGLVKCDENITRNYMNFHILRLRDNILNYDENMRQVFLSIVSKLSKTIVNLEINNCYILRDDVITLLKPFENLVEMKLENLMLSDDYLPSQQLGNENELSLSCPNLRILRLIQCDFYCMLLLKAHDKLHTLEIAIPSYVRTDVEELENFLLKQTELKELKLVNFRFNSSYSSQRLSNVPFQLTTLYLQDVQWDILSHCTMFLKSQHKLKNFFLRRFRSWIFPKETNFAWFCDTIKHILIYNPLEKLVIDTVNSVAYIKDAEFLNDLCNNHVTHLTYIRDQSDNSELFIIFMRLFPKVRTFEFSDGKNDANILDKLHLFKNLQEIMLVTKPKSLDSFSQEIVENLTSFKFYATNEDKTIGRLRKLFSKNSKIETLVLEIEPLTIEEITELIISFSSTLRFLRIQDLHLNQTEAELFISNFPKLRFLSSDVAVSQEVLNIFNNSHINFRLSNGSRF